METHSDSGIGWKGVFLSHQGPVGIKFRITVLMRDSLGYGNRFPQTEGFKRSLDLLSYSPGESRPKMGLPNQLR